MLHIVETFCLLKVTRIYNVEQVIKFLLVFHCNYYDMLYNTCIVPNINNLWWKMGCEYFRAFLTTETETGLPIM